MGCPELTIYDYFRFVKADGSASPLFYNQKGQLVKQISPGGRATLYQYNAKGELELSAIDINNNGVIDLAGPDRVTKYEDSVLSANGANVRRATTYIFPENDATPVTASVNDTEVSGLQSWSSSFGRTVSSSTVYNGGGQKTVTITNPDASTLTNIYLNGLLMSSTHSVLGTTTYAYDPHNRLASETKTINNQPQTTNYTYDAGDRLVSLVESSTGVPPVYRVTEFTYDSMGRRTVLALPGNRTINYTYSPTGELASVSGADTYPVSYSYDSIGRLKTLTDGNGSTTSWNYDPLRGFMTSKTYADNSSVSYTYNPNGSLATRVWARGITTNYTYDNAGDLSSVSYTDNGQPATGNVSFTCDRLGRPVSVTDGAGTRTLSYNEDSSISSESIPYVPDHTINYGYDSLGRRVSLALGPAPYALSHIYTYDSMSRLSSVGTGAVSKVPERAFLSEFTTLVCDFLSSNLTR